MTLKALPRQYVLPAGPLHGWWKPQWLASRPSSDQSRYELQRRELQFVHLGAAVQRLDSLMHTKMHILLQMEFTCNVIKNDTNIRERGLPLLTARVMFDAEMMVREDTRKAYPEPRFIGYNRIEGRLMVVVFCCPTPQRTHIISFRKANDREQNKFKTQSL